MKFRDCTSMNSTENIQEGYRNGLSKTGPEFKNCEQQLHNDHSTITAQTLLAKCDHHRFQRSILQFPPLGKKYRIAGMFTVSRALRTPRDVERRESGSMFCETIETIS